MFDWYMFFVLAPVGLLFFAMLYACIASVVPRKPPQRYYHRRSAYHGSGQQFNNSHRQYIKQQAWQRCRQQCGCQCQMWECQLFQQVANDPFWDGISF